MKEQNKPLGKDNTFIRHYFAHLCVFLCDCLSFASWCRSSTRHQPYWRNIYVASCWSCWLVVVVGGPFTLDAFFFFLVRWCSQRTTRIYCCCCYILCVFNIIKMGKGNTAVCCCLLLRIDYVRTAVVVVMFEMELKNLCMNGMTPGMILLLIRRRIVGRTEGHRRPFTWH